jgi:hypothetical protein
VKLVLTRSRSERCSSCGTSRCSARVA